MFGVFRKAVAVERRAPGSFVNGIWYDGAVDDSVTSVLSSVQPASRDDLQRLPEGQRITGSYRLTTQKKLLIAVDGQSADKVLIEGVWHLVVSEEIWGNGIIPHYAYLATRIVEGA